MHDEVFIIEANRDGQMAQILRMNYPEYALRICSIAHMDGLPLSAEWIEKEIKTNRIQK